MHLMGVEPTRESHWNLSPARLPIPPQVHMRKNPIGSENALNKKYNPLKFLPEGFLLKEIIP